MSTVVVGTAGHIDHGKSALVRALTGVDPDRLPEERARGITIDLGFAHADLGGVEIAFVDVPGHERFVRNMLAGAGGIDAVMLVVAANEGVKPQTREHFEICRLLGIERGVIAITKSDVADAAALTATRSAVAELTRGTFLADAAVVPVSALTGAGLDDLRTALRGLAGGGARLHRAGIVRLPVDRVFTVKGFGAVVTGTLVSGEIGAGDELAVLPENVHVRVRGLQAHGRAVTRVAGPQRAAVNLAGIDVAELRRGQTLATPDSLAVTLRADVLWQPIAGLPALRHGQRVRVHAGTQEAIAKVGIPAAAADPPGAVRAPDTAVSVVRLRFESAVAMTRGDRLIVRSLSPAATLGGAVVLDPQPPPHGLRRAAAAARLAALRAASDRDAAAQWIDEAGGRGLDEAAFVRRLGLDAAGARAMLAELARACVAVAMGARVFSTRALEDIVARVRSELAAFHRAHPMERGVASETLRSRFAARATAELVDAAIARLREQGVVRADAERVALTAHKAPSGESDSPLARQVEARLREAGLTPLDSSALAGALGAPRDRITQVLDTLTRDKRLLRLGELHFHADVLRELKERTIAARRARPAGERVTLDVGAFKTEHALTRKHAIPLLEWLDREGVTRRIGDVRVVLPR